MIKFQMQSFYFYSLKKLIKGSV